MLYSQLFGKTKLNFPHDANSLNAKYLTQAGFIDQLAAGIYNFLPLGIRVLQKINHIIREEMNKVDGQEILMPSLHPLEIWEKTGRSLTMDDILYRTKSGNNKDFVFGPSHEETVTPLAKRFIQSYKDLPFALYQIQTKFRDETRAKSGVLRCREFGMKDMYSFHRDEKDLDEYYERVKQAYLNVYKRCGLEAYVVEASGGAFTEKLSHEFSVITSAGEDRIIVCKKCGIAQNIEIAEGKIAELDEQEKELEVREKNVDRDFSIAASARVHNVPEWKILKTVIYKAESGFFGVLLRGDLQVNEHKLTRYLGKILRPATAEEILDIGLVQGFISPVTLTDEGKLEPLQIKIGGHSIPLPFLADHSINQVKNFITGANKYHVDLVNINPGRDFTVKDFSDFVSVEKGFYCQQCDLPLEEEKAVEAGNIFKLGTKYSKDFDVCFTDENGERKMVIMGCYGIGNTRLVGTIVEASHDEKGIIWPKSVAPFLVYLLTLGSEPEVKQEAQRIYQDILSQNIDVLFDDRDESAGKKLKDADLIGIPLRLVVSKRTLAETGLEWKLRSAPESRIVKRDDVLKEIIIFRDQT